MSYTGRLIGAWIGFIFGRIFGAIIGFFIGSLFDSAASKVIVKRQNNEAGRDEFMSVLAKLSALIMNADGKLTRLELDYMKQFFLKNFGESATLKALAIIKEHRDGTPIYLSEVCSQIRFRLPLTARTQLLYFLFGLAKVDGDICKEELKILKEIANRLDIDAKNFDSIKSMFGIEDVDAAYQTLGVNKNDDDATIKKAYRKMAIENHPDKVSHLGDDIRKSAEDRFKHINLAYEKIKKARNIK